MSLEQTLRQVIWPRRGVRGWAAWLALQPARMAFGTGVALRNAAYQFGVLHSEAAGVPVISVGNLAVGGTGKTPITLWLARQLADDGSKVAIVLRGYTGSASGVTVVSEGDGALVDVNVAGDEAVMLAKNFNGTVITARRRIDGARRARELGCRIVVLDDGFQHRRLARDFDLVLINGREGALLPCGPMREPRAALHRADAIALVSKVPSEPAPLGKVSSAAGKPLFLVRFVPTALVESVAGLWRERPLKEISGRKVAVIAGIANPQPFYTTLRQWEVQVGEVFEFPDHHRYTSADWRRLSRATHNFDYIITTEKDLVKLENFPFARGKLLALRVTPEVTNGEQLIRLIRDHIAASKAAHEEERHAD